MEQTLITITGPIGVGKSTAIKTIAEKLGYEFFPEVIDTPEDKKILSQYYKILTLPANTKEEKEKIENIVTLTEIWFIKKRHQDLKKITNSKKNTIMERHIWDNLHIFTKENYLQGHLTDRFYHLINEIANSWMEELTKPKIIIILMASPEELRKRISERGRPEERSLLDKENKYLERTIKLYKEMQSNLKNKTKIKIINTDGFSHKETAQKIIEELTNI